jgi:NAD(P)-dependent dehydrogenase (short-subunit alcohol dehydrogenase family)
LIEKTIEIFGQIDVLILNAGISAHFLFEDMENMEVFKRLMEVNFFGCVYPTRYALPHLKKTHGQLVVMSSYSGEVGLIYRTGYCATKFAVTGFFESLRMET